MTAFVPPYSPSLQDWQRQVATALNPALLKLNQYEVAAAYGVAGDGITDDTSGLTSFFNHAISNPGVCHYLDAKIYAIGAPLPTINVSNVWIEGIPGDVHSVGSIFSGTVIKQIGSASAVPMLSIIAPAGVSNQFLTGIRIKGIGFDCNSLAAYGVRIQTVRQSEFDLSGANATTRLFDLGVIAGSLGENQSLQTNLFRLRGRQVESNAPCLYLDGSSVANVSMNDFFCDFLHANSPAIICANSDNNKWRLIRTFCAGTATESVQLFGGTSSIMASRDEIFHHVTTNKPIKVYGTADYTVASSGHRVISADWDNGTPSPVLGTGAWIDCELPQSFTPTITGTTGTGLVTSSVSGSYIRQFGFVDAVLTFVMSAGTGYASLSATLPFACAGAIGQVSVAKERASTGKLFSGFLDALTNSLVIQSADGSTAIPTGTYNAAVRYRVR